MLSINTSIKGNTMNNQMLNLGVLLLMILLVISIGSLTLFFTNNTNNLFGIGLAVILLLVVVTFISYLLFDLYSSNEEKEESDYRSSRRSISENSEQTSLSQN